MLATRMVDWIETTNSLKQAEIDRVLSEPEIESYLDKFVDLSGTMPDLPRQ